jgi:hypothetical protein
MSLLAAAALIGVAAIAPQPVQAGVAPWCAVKESLPYGVVWDCGYWTLEQCLPQVVTGIVAFATRIRNGAVRGLPASSAAAAASSRY